MGNQLKKFFSLVIALVCAAICMIPSAGAEYAPTRAAGSTTWRLAKKTVAPGSDVTLGVMLQNPTTLKEIDNVGITADGPIVPTGMSDYCEAYGGAIKYSISGNTINFDIKNTTGSYSGGTDKAIIFNVYFHVPNNCPEGTYNVTWTTFSTVAFTPSDSAYYIQYTNSTITVSGSASVETTTTPNKTTTTTKKTTTTTTTKKTTTTTKATTTTTKKPTTTTTKATTTTTKKPTTTTTKATTTTTKKSTTTTTTTKATTTTTKKSTTTTTTTKATTTTTKKSTTTTTTTKATTTTTKKSTTTTTTTKATTTTTKKSTTTTTTTKATTTTTKKSTTTTTTTKATTTTTKKSTTTTTTTKATTTTTKITTTASAKIIIEQPVLAQLTVGKTFDLKYSFSDQKQFTDTKWFYSNNDGVASITNTGKVTINGPGTVTLTMGSVTTDGRSIENNITFTVPKNEIMLGDVNGDKIVDARDATLILKHVTLVNAHPEEGGILKGDALIAANVDPRNILQLTDATLVLCYSTYANRAQQNAVGFEEWRDNREKYKAQK